MQKQNYPLRWPHRLRPRRLMGRFTGPRVLLVSVPKAGTNLMLQLLSLLPQLRDGGMANTAPENRATVLTAIAGIQPGQFFRTHLWWTWELPDVLVANDIKGLFVYRDPRDVCVSYFHYLMRLPQHWCYHYFTEVLTNDDDRLMTVIKGVDEWLPDGSRAYLESVDYVFRSRFEYMNQPRFCSVSFEDLIGQKGGGDDDKQLLAMDRVIEHLGLRWMTRGEKNRIARQIFSPKSGTFRRGQIGSWRTEMSEAHKSTFKEVAGQLLIDLGYEADMNW